MILTTNDGRRSGLAPQKMGMVKKLGLAITLPVLLVLHLFFVFSIPSFFFIFFSSLVLPDLESAKVIGNQEVKERTLKYCGLDVSVKLNEIEKIDGNLDGKDFQFYALEHTVVYGEAAYNVKSVVYDDLRLFNLVRHNVELYGVLRCRELQP